MVDNLACLRYSAELLEDSQELPSLWIMKFQKNTMPVDRSRSGGTGPSAYGTGPTVINNLGPVPNYCFMKNFED